MKLAKFLSLGLLSISLSGLLHDPASANPAGENMNRLAQNSAAATSKTKLGRVIGTSGSTVTVAFRDGSTKDYEVTAEEIRVMNLGDDTYVTVDEERIIGVASSGRVIAVVGDVLTYKLVDGSVGHTSLSGQGKVSALDLKPGTFIYVSGGEIISVSNTEQMAISRPVQTRTSSLERETTTRTVREVRTAPVMTERVAEPVPEPVVREEPIERPATIKKPVRGMW